MDPAQTQRIHELFRLVVDEAHHIGAPTFRSLVDKINPHFLVGATATPWRGDGFDIDTVLGPAVVEIGIEEGLRRGFLSETDYRIFADNIDWKFVQRASKNSYSISQLNRRLIIPTRDDKAANLIAGVFRSECRKTCISYSPTGAHAKHFAAVLRQYGLRAEAVLAEFDHRLREARMSRFKAGDLDVAVTVDLFNEGVDVPDVDLIVFMRATHSRRIFVQQLGRGLRLSTTKDKVIVLDFVTDVRRVAEVLELDRAVKGNVERLGMGGHLVSFSDESAGSFLSEWVLDQASLSERPGDHELRLPDWQNFPEPEPPGNVQ